MDEYADKKRTEKNLIVQSSISEAETTNNKRLRSTFCIEAIQIRSIAGSLCDSRASWISCRHTHPSAYQISIPTSINFGDTGVQKLTKWGLLIP